MRVKLAVKYHETRAPGRDSPALVILHGLFGSANNWRRLAQQLSSDYPVHALDLRNHGASPHHPHMTYANMAGDVAGYLDHALTRPPVLIGHSMGGKAAMRLALAEGHRLARLIVVDIAPVPNRHDFDNLLDAMTELDTRTLKRRSDADKALQKRVPEESLRQFLLQNLIRGKTGYQWRINLDAIRSDMEAILDFPRPDEWEPFERPTLFIRGEQSNYIRAEHDDVIHELFPKARTTTIRNAGHWLHAEQPQQFLHEVRNFLET